MDNISTLFKNITSCGEITLVQKGFLYESRVDTRTGKLTLKEFIILLRHFLENKYLAIQLEIKGKENASKVLVELEKYGMRVSVLRNELNWITATDVYELDILLTSNLPEDKVKSLISTFYVVEDAVLVWPIGYMSWGEYFQKSA